MRAVRGRRAAWACGAALAALLAGGAYALRGVAAEWWWIRKLGSKDGAEVRVALERLGERRSVRAVPRMVDLYRERAEANDTSLQKLVQDIGRAAGRIGPRALLPLLREGNEYARSMLVRACSESPDGRERLLLACVRAGDASDFPQAIKAFEARRPEAEPVLLAALDDPHRRVREAAAYRLSFLRPRHAGVRRSLGEALEDPDPAVRREVSQWIPFGIQDCGETARYGLPAFVQLLEDPDPRARRQAAWMLGASSSDDALPALVRALDDPDGDVRFAARSAIVRLSLEIEESAVRRKLVPALRRRLREGDAEAARMAALVLGVFRADGREAWPALLEHWLRRPGAETQVASIAHRMGPRARAAVPVLLEALPKAPWNEAVLIAKALAAIGPAAQEALPALKGLLASPGDKDGRALAAAAEAIAAIRRDSGEAFRWLRAVLQDKGRAFALREAAALALPRLRHPAQEVCLVLRAVLEDEADHLTLRWDAGQALSELGPAARDAVPSLERLAAGSEWRRQDAARMLWRIDPGRISGIVLQCVDLLSTQEVNRALRTLRELGAAAAAAGPALVALLAQHPWSEPAAALRSIGKPAVPALIEALRSEDVVVRAQAAEVLASIGPGAEAAAPALEAALSDEDEEVRREAKKALEKVAALKRLHAPPDPLPAGPPKLAPLLRDAAGAPIASREGWERRREELRRAWTAFLGELPRERGPLEAEVLETEELTKVTRKRVRYRVEDGVSIDAYLLVPWDLPGDGSRKAPGVVVFHSTVDSHAGEPAGVDSSRARLHIGWQLAERGFVVLCPRCYIFEEGASYAGNVGKTLARHPSWKGMTRMVLDGMRAADFLESLPFVDSKRLGCMGHSLGAKETLYAAAFDERFKAAVFSEGGIGLGMSNWDAVWYLGPRIQEPGFDREHHELLALVAPRAFLILAGGAADDARAWAYVDAALPVYKLLGAEERFGWLQHGFGHDYPREARAAAEEALERWLK